MGAEVEPAAMCFACGPDNPIGLKIRFECEDDRCRASLTPDSNHVGWENTVHGGIIYAALDDVTANVMHKQGRKAHTARCEIRYRQPLYVGETIELEGWVERRRGRLVMLRGEARKAEDQSIVADCTASFMLVDQE
jgi:uncharacterized protein (TIGR00369 family)